jgi:NDP-sugar pyrophosphorylase family protein
MNVIIMAGGEGKRMQSSTPKVLHKVMGEPMIVRIIKRVNQLTQVGTIYIVCGSSMKMIETVIMDYIENTDNIVFVNQPVARGTGDAIRHCLPYFGGNNNTNDTDMLILNGDTPLIDNTLDVFTKASSPALMVTNLAKPYGNGRIVTDENGSFQRIVEEKDANEQEKKITLVNCGVYLVSTNDLLKFVPMLTTNNAQNEYYLTDICGFVQNKLYLVEIPHNIQYELINVNCPADLMMSERYAIQRHLSKQGLSIRHLKENDCEKGYLQLLCQLSDTIDNHSHDFFKNMYQNIRQNNNHHIYVIEDTTIQQIVGSVTLFIEPKFIHNGMSVGHIEDVVVSSSHRSKKIGSFMIDYVNTFMIEHNCYKFILDCFESLERFYSKSGYEKRNIQMALYKP